MNIKNRIFAIFIIVLLFLITQGCSKRTTDTNSIFNSLGISVKGFDDFAIIENKNNRLVIQDNGIILTILLNKNIEKEIATKLIEDKTIILESQYEIRDAPYPGEITREVVCPEEFKPVKNVINNKNSIVNYQLYSTKSLTYGACAKDLIVYKAFLGFFYCDGKGLFQIEFFVPINDEEKFNEMLQKVSTFKC